MIFELRLLSILKYNTKSELKLILNTYGMFNYVKRFLFDLSMVYSYLI